MSIFSKIFFKEDFLIKTLKFYKDTDNKYLFPTKGVHTSFAQVPTWQGLV